MAAITELKQELEQELEQANHAISMAQGRMARQREIMRRLEADGHDAAQAKTLFREIEDALENDARTPRASWSLLSCGPGPDRRTASRGVFRRPFLLHKPRGACPENGL